MYSKGRRSSVGLRQLEGGLGEGGYLAEKLWAKGGQDPFLNCFPKGYQGKKI